MYHLEWLDCMPSDLWFKAGILQTKLKFVCSQIAVDSGTLGKCQYNYLDSRCRFDIVHASWSTLRVSLEVDKLKFLTTRSKHVKASKI